MNRGKSRATKTTTRTKMGPSWRGPSKAKRRTPPDPAVDVAASQSRGRQKYRERCEDGSCGHGLAAKLRKYLETADGSIDLTSFNSRQRKTASGLQAT